jgi:hypothetical protein
MNWTIDMMYNAMMKGGAQDLIDTTLILKPQLDLDYTQNNLSM